MSLTVVDEPAIPAALPGVESDDDDSRQKLANQAAAQTENKSAPNAATPVDSDDDDDETDDAPELGKPSKKKLFFAFVCFVCFFVLLIAALCWFFGIGLFAEAPTKKIDRTAKTNVPTAPATEDEKLKMALNIVAEKDAIGSANSTALEKSNVEATDTAPLDAAHNAAPLESSITVPDAARAADLNVPVFVQDDLAKQSSAAVNSSIAQTSSNVDSGSAQKNQNEPEVFGASQISVGKQSNSADLTAPGRSLFFGVQPKEKPVSALPVADNQKIVLNQIANNGLNQNANYNPPETKIPFGTLLPVRFLGAVYTLRASGGLVRMELVRNVAGKNFAFPAGTVVVGALRGSEYKRAFVSIIGLIDPATGELVKFTGETMGADGASGVVGRRRKVKNVWARALNGLRETGALALNTINSRRSGGTVVISDTASQASGALSGELSGLMRNDSQAKEFVEILAGTNAYVLVTDLPNQNSGNRASGQTAAPFDRDSTGRAVSATGLSEDELADLFSDGSPDKLRAALPRMTPEFRRLAEQVMAAQAN